MYYLSVKQLQQATFPVRKYFELSSMFRKLGTSIYFVLRLVEPTIFDAMLD